MDKSQALTAPSKSAIPRRIFTSSSSSVPASKASNTTSLPSIKSVPLNSSANQSRIPIPAPKTQSPQQCDGSTLAVPSKGEPSFPTNTTASSVSSNMVREASALTADSKGEGVYQIGVAKPLREADSFNNENPERTKDTDVAKAVDNVKRSETKIPLPSFSRGNSIRNVYTTSSPVGSHRDNDMKKNLLSMLAKSENKQKHLTKPFSQRAQESRTLPQSPPNPLISPTPPNPLLIPPSPPSPLIEAEVKRAGETIEAEKATTTAGIKAHLKDNSEVVGRKVGGEVPQTKKDDSLSISPLTHSLKSSPRAKISAKECDRSSTNKLLPVTTMTVKPSKTASSINSLSLNHTSESMVTSGVTISLDESLAHTDPLVIVSTKETLVTSVTSTCSFVEQPEISVSLETSNKKNVKGAAIFSTSNSNDVTVVSSTNLGPSPRILIPTTSSIEIEESDKCSDSLRSGESERNLAPLSEEFENNRGKMGPAVIVSVPSINSANLLLTSQFSDSLPETSSLPDLNQAESPIRRTNSPSKQLLPWYNTVKVEAEQLRSQLKLAHEENEAQDSKLRQVQKQVAEMKITSDSLRRELEREKNTVNSLKKYIEKESLALIQLQREHANEMTSIRKEMEQKQETERTRLLNQIRELTNMKEQKTAQVNELEGSLSEAKKMASASSTTLELTEAKHSSEIQQLKTELQALQDFHKATEEMCSSMSSKNTEAEKRIKRLLSENKELAETIKDQKEARDCLQLQLQESENCITQLQKEKAESKANREKEALERNVEIEVKYQEKIDNLEQKLEDMVASKEWLTQQLEELSSSSQRSSRATTPRKSSRKVCEAKERHKKIVSDVSAHYLEDTVSSTNKKNPTNKYNSLERRPCYTELTSSWSHQRSFTMPPSHSNDKILKFVDAPRRSVKERGRTKTFPIDSSQRLNRKQGEEILVILGELKTEGFNVTNATPDRIISYLWMKRKRAREDLEEANKALREKIGDKQFRQLQEWKMEAEDKTDKLRLAEQQLEISGRTAKATQDLLKKKLEDLLQQSSEREESAYAEQKKSLTSSLMTENRSLKDKVAKLRGEIMSKSASISQTEGDLSESKRKNESMERELTFEMRQRALLEAKVDNLQKQLKQQMLKFNSLQEDSLNVTKDGTQHRAEVGRLKAKIGKLEGEVSVLQQELVHEREEKKAVQSQVETYSSQILLLQSQNVGGNSTIADLKSKISSLMEDCQHQNEDLERESTRSSLLEKEVETLKKSLHDAQRKNASLEAEFLRLRAEHKCTHQELVDSTKSIVEFEKKMKLSAEDLQVNRELSKQLQEVVSVTKHELSGIRKKLEQEKQTNTVLQETIQTVNKKLEGCNSEFAAARKDVNQKKLEVQQLEQDKSTLLLDIEQLQSSIESLKRQLYQSQKDLKSSESALEKRNTTLIEMKYEAETALREVESNKALIEELRSKLAMTEAEMERLSASKSAATSENLEFRTRITELKVQLAEKKSLFEKKEEEVISLKREKSLIHQDLSDAKRESSSHRSLNSELQKEVELRSNELQIERRNLQEIVEEFKKKSEELRTLKISLENMEASMTALHEEKSSLEIELANIQGECMATKSLKKSLEQRLECCLKKSEEEEAYYHKSLEEIRTRLDHSQMELMTLTKRYSSLEVESKQSHALRESCENELAVLREEHHLVKGNLASTVKVKNALEEKVDSLQKQMDESMEQLVQKTSELKEVQTALSMAQTQLDDMERELSMHKEDLAATTESIEQLQIEDEHKAEQIRMLAHEVQKAREELQLEQSRADSNSDEATSLHSKCKELSEKLHQHQQELCEAQIAREDSHANYVTTINSLKEQHEQRVEDLRSENDSLHAELAQLNDQLFSKERELSTMKEDLDTAMGRLTSAETTCMKQRAELTAKEDSHEMLKSDHLQLESRSVEARTEITDLKGKLSTQTTTNDLLKSELNETKRECSSLKEKLKMQRDTTASSLNKMQQENQEKCAQLRAKIQEMSEKMNQANSSMLHADQEISKLQVENERMMNSLAEESDLNRRIRHELQEQVSSLKVLEQQVEQSQNSTDIERNAKMEYKQDLSDERAKRQNLELVIAEQDEKYNMVTRELCQVQKSYKKEESRNEKLKMEVSQLKEEIMELKHHHDVLNEQYKISKQQLEYEISSIRQKYHSDKKSLKEKIKGLHDTLQNSMEQLEAKSRHIQSLESNARTLSEHIDELNRKLSSSDEKLQSKREECKKLRTKQHAFEIQVTQLQADIRGLETAQLQMDEFRKKAEAKSKSEIKRVLSEVSEQMEQQNTAQKYLEKLRSENEMVALKEKERIISELRNELKLTRQESKKDRMHLEQLKMESLHLKNQQMEQDKSRRRLEARLEQVNDTLSKTLPTRHLRSMMTQESPMFSSTPTPSRSYSGYRS